MIALASSVPRLAGRPIDLCSVQAMHVTPTPRVGGVGLFAAMAATIYFAPDHLTRPYAEFILATSILFAAGLSEDLGWHVSPRMRLLAATISSLLVVFLLDAWVPRLGLPLIDSLMANGSLGIPLTIFATVGLANAFNLIDGVNGLSGLTAIICSIGLGVISVLAGYDAMVTLLALLTVAIAGFLIFNYPFGLIFLGDAGAYTLGFVLAWFGVAVIMNNPEVSAWAVLLTMFWPIMDTLLAIYRRSMRNKSAMQPDRLHVHQLVMRTLEISVLGRGKRRMANSLTALVLAPFIALPTVAGVFLWDDQTLSMIAFLCLIALYFAGYFLAARAVRTGFLRRKVLPVNATNAAAQRSD